MNQAEKEILGWVIIAALLIGLVMIFCSGCGYGKLYTKDNQDRGLFIGWGSFKAGDKEIKSQPPVNIERLEK